MEIFLNIKTDANIDIYIDLRHVPGRYPKRPSDYLLLETMTFPGNPTSSPTY